MPEWPFIQEETLLPDYTQNPNAEPIKLAAGDTITFTRSIPAYLASLGWSLKYSMRGVVGSAPDFVSVANGDNHQVSVPSGITAGWAAGKYKIQGRAINNTLVPPQEFLIYDGQIEILPNLSALPASYDTRSHARICLDAIEQVLQGRAADDVMDTEIEGMKVGRMAVDALLKFRDRYRAEVRTEEAEAKVRNGLASGRRILTRFSPAGFG